jgi:hypothetical protein
MSQDRLHQIRSGFADDTSHGDEPPDLGPLRALAEREELATRWGGWPMRMAVRCVPTIR